MCCSVFWFTSYIWVRLHSHLKWTELSALGSKPRPPFSGGPDDPMVITDLVSHCQTFLLKKEGLAITHSIPGWEKKRSLVYWHFFKPITIVLGDAKSRTEQRCLCKIASGRNLFWWNVFTFKSSFSRATENSDWTDSLASCLDLPCRDLRSS